MKFIHTADWHLGMTRHFLSEEAQARFSEARLDAVRAIAALAEAEECSFVVASGDVFNSNQLDRQTIVRALDAMSSFTVPLFLLPASHDPLNAASVYRSAVFLEQRPENVIVLDTFQPVEVPGAGAEVVGAPWESKQPLEDLAAKACASLSSTGATLRVLVAHGAVDEGNPNQQNPALIRLGAAREAIASGVVNYIALGDRHSATKVDESDRIWYSGTPLVTDFREVDPNSVLLIDLGQDSVDVEARQIGSWSFTQESFAVNNGEEVAEVESWLQALGDKRNTVLKLSFVGTLSLTESAHLESVLEHNQDLFAAIEAWERHTDLAVLPDDSDLSELGLIGFASDAVDDLREQASQNTEAGRTAQDALALLYRLVHSD
ncbi:MAG: metallophosphoesterase [Gaiellaceae bacterium]